MFGNNKPFGTATAFGGSSFGSTTPFGQTSTAFGAKPATSNVFGTSSFGVSQPNTGGLFGTTPQQTGSGLFGQPSNTFGTPASTSTGSFGFGATSTSGGLFGNTAPAMQSSGGLFGGSTSAFGAPRPAFGGFGTTNTGTGLFGQTTNTGTGLFGATGGFTATAPAGTTFKFNPPTGTDTMMKGGVSTSIGTRHQCITCMKEYENKSLEELRVEDYAANRKGGGAAAGGMGFGATTQQTGLFGSTPAASTSAFSFGNNTTQSKPLFGTTGTTNAFGGTGSLFGQPAPNQNAGLFGKTVGFGATTTASTPVFSFGGTNTMGTGTSLFGQNNQQKPLFGQTTSATGGLFGNTATTQTTGFGATTGFGGFGATNQPSTGLFGAKPTGFGTANTTTTNSFSFGNTNNMSGGLFGQKPAAPAFGTSTGFGTPSTGFGSFGTTTNTGTGLFGQNKPATSMFGATGNTFGAGLGSSFGTSTFPSMGGLGTNTGTGLFGSNTANKAPGFNFGGTGSTGFNFGGGSNTSSFNFNPSSSLVGGNDPNNSAALQQVQQQILAMTANPFGDSPLFRNTIKDTSRESEVLKPTNPSAQKALLNDSQYKVALLPTAKMKPKPWSPSPTGKTFLFDGLEDEEPSLSHAAFLPKKSVKKLVLKNLGANRSSIMLTSDITGGSSQNTRIDVSISLNKSPSSRVVAERPASSVPLTVDISDTSVKNFHNSSDAAISVPNKSLEINKSPSDVSLSISPDVGLRIMLQNFSMIKSSDVSVDISSQVNVRNLYKSLNAAIPNPNITVESVENDHNCLDAISIPVETIECMGNVSKCFDAALSMPNEALEINKSHSGVSLNFSSGLKHHNSMDDSIAALHTNKPGFCGRTFNVLSESEDDVGDKDISSEDGWNSNSASTGDNAQLSPNKSGVILNRPEYYIIPPIDELESYVDQNGDCYVDNFTVGREHYGKVNFPGRMNVARLNLDEIVHFHKKEINVYPNDDKKPPVGEGLNRKAVVTLEKVWPTDKTNHSPIKDPERLSVVGYREKIERSTNRLGAKFIDYIPESGCWIFQVDHFSKYGLEDSDEEMDVSKPPENKLKVPPTGVELNGQTQPLNSATQKQVLKRKPITGIPPEDDSMGDIPFLIEVNKPYLFPEGDDFVNDVYSPTRPLFSTQIDAERIQGMKASFFQEMDEDNWAPYQHQPESLYGIRKENDLKSFPSSLSSSKLSVTMDNFAKKQRYLDYDGEQTYLSPTPPVKFVDTGIQGSMSSLSLSQSKQNEWLSAYPLVKSVQQPSHLEKQVHSLNKIHLKPLEKSVLSAKHHLLADTGYFMGRRFRPGWRSDGALVVVQPPTDSDNFIENYPKFLLYGDNVAFASKINKTSGFSLVLQRVKMDTMDNSEKQMQFLENNLVEALKLQLESSISTVEGEAPLFVPKPGVELIHSHAKLFEGHLKDTDSLDSNTSFTQQSVHVWNLLVSLWGKVRGLDDDEDETVSNYAVQMARREALSSWLIKASENRVTKEIAHLNQDSYLTKMFLYLSCRRVSDAVKLAHHHQDFRLSLLLSQAEGTPIVRKWLCSQLLNWEQNGAYKFMKYDRILLYALLAGLLLWQNVYETINCCKNLDWKQALALHLWYLCEPNASIQVAVQEYDTSYQGLENKEKYSLPPYPPYASKEMFDDTDTPDSEVVYDTCYHLLKLYCNRAHRFDQLLMPQTYTTDHLDYRLSWLLHLALSSVGFNIPLDLSCTLHMNFASQLESIDMWHWAVFVYFHHPDTEWRVKNVKDILLRHVSLALDEETEEKEKFLKESLLVPEKWIFEAKAIKAHSLGKHAEEAWFLLKAGSWNKSHSIVIKYLASDAVINEDYDYLMKYLSELAVPERSCTILDWSSGGQVYLDYINMCQMVQGVLSMETSAYDLEKFTPEVLSLCNRLSSIPTPTIKDRLSVAEMAKKTATIMRSIAILQAGRTKNKSSLIMLASYFKNLPMPHDYAVSENRFITHCFLQEVTSDTQATY